VTTELRRLVILAMNMHSMLIGTLSATLIRTRRGDCHLVNKTGDGDCFYGHWHLLVAVAELSEWREAA
jgi:hypothetical protein